MGKYVELDEAKRHLNVEEDYTGDDAYIGMLIDVSESKMAAELCMGVDEMGRLGDDGDLPLPLKQAILLNVGSYYANREEATYTQSKALVQGALYLVQLYRNYSL